MFNVDLLSHNLKLKDRTDLINKKDQQEILSDVLKRGSRLSFPKIIVDDKIMITGFDKDKIKEAVEN